MALGPKWAALKNSPIQTKLTLSEPGDALEQEADRVADRVMRMPNTVSSKTTDSPAHLRGSEQPTATVPPAVADVILSLKQSGGQVLPNDSQRFFEERFGQDFSGVRVHSGPLATNTAKRLGAKAFTVGQHVVFGFEQYRPETSVGRRLLAHELTHVAQQRMARALVVQREAALIELEPMVIQGVACPCGPSTQTSYDAETFSFATSLKPLVDSLAGARGVSPTAVAGAIADEYNTRRFPRSIVDKIQDAVVGALPEIFISVDRFFDIHSKLLNTLENDIGLANIKVRTALEAVQAQELEVPGSPPSDIKVNRIVSYLLSERGTVATAAAVIAKAQRLIGPYLTEAYGDDMRDAVLVEYFKQGDRYYSRFKAKLASDPSHHPCPGEGGCRFMFNYDGIRAALS